MKSLLHLPNVRLLAVAGFVNDFRCHPVRSALPRAHQVTPLHAHAQRQFARAAEIDELQRSFRSDHDVATLDVTDKIQALVHCSDVVVF